MNAEELNQTYARDGHLSFEDSATGQPIAIINNAFATARVSLQCGQVLEYQPHGEAPVLWVSPFARYAPGKTIRGGIPVCWPWFGAHPEHADWPAHGFVRSAIWHVAGSGADDDGATQLSLRPDAGAYGDYWPQTCALELSVTVGETLSVAMITHNAGETTVSVTAALHTYFNISDIADISVHGLDGIHYLDKAPGGVDAIQRGPITFSTELDRVYEATPHDCVIHDPGMSRHIRVAKRGSHTTVVWNPWIEKGLRLGDMGDDGYKHMVCVETANAAHDIIRLPAGAEHHLVTEISVERPS